MTTLPLTPEERDNTPMGPSLVVNDDAEESLEDFAFETVASTWCATAVVAASPEGIDGDVRGLVGGDGELLGPAPVILVDAEESLEVSAAEAVASSGCATVVVSVPATPEGIESTTGGQEKREKE
jgi:hypothetical protein